MNTVFESLQQFWGYTGFANMTWQHFVMIGIGIIFITLAILKDWEPLLLVPIGFGMIIGNIPFIEGLKIGIYEQGSVMNILYQGVQTGWYPPLIFLGIGAMTDFSALISQPRLMLIGAAAQIGIFGAYVIALHMGFVPAEAGAIGIIGGADGPTAIFLSSKLAPHLMGAIAVSAYSYMALVPVIQRPIMLLLTTKKERLIRMAPPRPVSQREKIIFPIVGFILTAFIVPSGMPLLGMLFFGNLLKESGVTKRLAETARGPLIDVVTILIGGTVGLLDTGKCLPYRKLSEDLPPRPPFIRDRYSLRSPLCEVHEPFPQGRTQDQPSHRKCRCVCRSGCSPSITERRT